jgi:hypothetical protein
MNKNSVKHLQGINYSQLTIAETTEIKNLGRAAPDVYFSLSSKSRIHTYARKFNRAVYAKWLSCCAKRNALLCLLNNPLIILAPAYHQKIPRATLRSRTCTSSSGQM